MLGLSTSQAVARCSRGLASADIDEARLEAELLVGEVVGRGREWLFLHPDEQLTPEQSARLNSLLARRLKREPLPYLLGRAEFYGLSFRATPAAIIPRPETEILVEAAVARAGRGRAHLAVDVGTGGGAMAVVLAKQIPTLRVVAVDVSLDALRLTRENCEAHGVAQRVHLVCSDLLDGISGEFDWVVANLPYCCNDEFPNLQPEVRDFEPRRALDGGPDGLALIRRLGGQLLGHLRICGFAALEVGAGQAQEVAKLLGSAGLSAIEVLRDYAGIERVVIGWRDGGKGQER
jgi:release factor glutamine methyltransferase